MYCSVEKVKLTPLIETPEPLRTFLAGESTDDKLFLYNIRKYNACFQMTYFCTTKDIRARFYDNV